MNRTRSLIPFLQTIILVLLIGWGCDTSWPTISFYHWKQQFKLTDYEVEKLDSVGCERLYIRFFDVDISETSDKPAFVSGVKIVTPVTDREIVPCVYITNRVLKVIDQGHIKMLASGIYSRLNKMVDEINPLFVKEIQIDCDWSNTTKERYFQLLTCLKNYLPDSLALSCTIRLHQVKYPSKTGVPPVDHGVLMLYNMGDISDSQESNSIFQTSVVRSYINSQTPKYPLELDLALPAYSWMLIYRFNRLVRIVHPGDEDSLLKNVNVKQIGVHNFEVVENFYYQGTFLYKGDQLRCEGIGAEQLLKTMKYLRRETFIKPGEIIFFHLDSLNLTRYDTKIFKELAN